MALFISSYSKLFKFYSIAKTPILKTLNVYYRKKDRTYLSVKRGKQNCEKVKTEHSIFLFQVN